MTGLTIIKTNKRWPYFWEKNKKEKVSLYPLKALKMDKMKIGIASDHGGFELKKIIHLFLKENGYEVFDFGAFSLNTEDDYPDFVIPLAEGVAQKKVDRGIAVCGSGVGAAIAANKIAGVRAALINDYFSAHQGVEDDDMNLICLGGRVTGFAAAQEYSRSFLNAVFSGAERHKRRLKKIELLEIKSAQA